MAPPPTFPMQVRFTIPIVSGSGAYQPGEVADLSDVMAAELIAAGVAEAATEDRSAVAKPVQRKATKWPKSDHVSDGVR